MAPPEPTYRTITSRRWRSFDVEGFMSALSNSDLCRPAHVDESPEVLADRYDSVITELLDEFALLSTIAVRQRSHRPWYDDECRQSRRKARKLQRHFRRFKTSESYEAWRVVLSKARKTSRSWVLED